MKLPKELIDLANTTTLVFYCGDSILMEQEFHDEESFYVAIVEFFRNFEIRHLHSYEIRNCRSQKWKVKILAVMHYEEAKYKHLSNIEGREMLERNNKQKETQT